VSARYGLLAFNVLSGLFLGLTVAALLPYKEFVDQ
jgi:hypothetical protein